MEASQLYTARAQVVEAMEQGFPWPEAAKRAGIKISQSTAYRLRQRMRQGGKQALPDGRHGHPAKLRGEVRMWLEQTCRQAPHTPSHEIQTQLAQQFSLQISVSQINRVRATLGVSNPPQSTKKRNQPTTKQEWQEEAGGLLLLAAARETNLLSQLEATLSAKQDGLGISRPSSPRLFDPQQALLLTLLFLSVVGLHRPWDLRSYTGQELALLTGRSRSYSYRHTERFLLKLSKLGGDQALTEALARWTASLWPAKDAARDTSSPYFYLDGHRKPVYTQTLIPRGLIGRSGKILGCRALTLLHDEQGHPLLATTHRGDLHLTAGIASLLTHYEQITNASLLTNLVVDREAMAAEFLAQLKAQGRTLTTILKTNQYAGLDSFNSVGAFVPLTVDRQGKVLREVAPAQFLLAHPNQNEESLRLAVVLIRDLRKVVPCSPSEENLPCAWWTDIRHEEVAWWQEGWQATPAPAPPTEPKLIPIVTTAEQIDALAVARAYIHRWPAQENVIKDFLLPLGLDINHGFAKVPVVNSEVTKKRRHWKSNWQMPDVGVRRRVRKLIEPACSTRNCGSKPRSIANSCITPSMSGSGRWRHKG